MVSVRTKHTEIRRLDKTHRHLSASAKKRSDVHKAKANATRKQTYAERKARKQDLDEHNQNVKEDMQLLRGELLDMCGTLVKKHGRTKEYWLTELVQAERIAKTQRSKNRWNAFVSMRMTQINAGTSLESPHGLICLNLCFRSDRFTPGCSEEEDRRPRGDCPDQRRMGEDE